MKKLNWLVGLGAVAILAGCAGSNEPDEYDVESYDPISNPASVFCVQQNGELQAFDENDQRVMYCVLSEDEKYEQWEYYKENYGKEKE
ncbi:putative hemolysin [Vibrio algarum]|uniref:DUF333 domain-containing protein n=1 Tax=Vibrio algarum TaxID=3020714 RepID=A0ABT4YXK3_9VIBR|nr:DUF333 domain-containing protein [Vibrio sp. KJ40-1]MDB1126326.1 DUF333 domain-containing protein [Vibrio sp. KJ40-1]